MKITKDILLGIEKKSAREKMKADGVYDGRYRTRKIKDKKKETNKKLCRKKIKNIW